MTKNEYTLVHGGEATKTAKSSYTTIHFDILKNQSNKLFIRMIRTKEDKGTFSDEIVPLWLIYNCVEKYISTNKSTSAQPFKECFTKYIANSPSCLAAVLRKLGLLKAYPNDPKKHLVKEYSEWQKFEDEMLATEGIPYIM